MSKANDIDVRCLPYMPLQVEQLRKSKTWLRCRRRPELGFYLMNLWMRAWHEVPAGSIENDDDVLADAAMCTPEKWEELRGVLLEGWEIRDGRVYHRTVTELATEAFGKLRKNSKRTEAAREAAKKAAEEKRSAVSEDAVTDTVKVPVTDAVTETATGTVTGPEGKGREGNNKKEDSCRKPSSSRISYPAGFLELWAAYPTDKIMSKKDAYAAWQKLDEPDRQAALAFVPAFNAYCKANPKYRAVHLVRYLTSRRFDNVGDETISAATTQDRNRDANGDLTNDFLFGGRG